MLVPNGLIYALPAHADAMLEGRTSLAFARKVAPKEGGERSASAAEPAPDGAPMLEVVAARDLKAGVVAAEAKADMVIDAACAKMNKTRADLERHMRI